MKRLFITIYILMLIGLFIIPFGIGPIIDEIFEEEAAKLDRDIARGTFYLFHKELAGLDIPAMKKKLESLQPHFGYPIGIYPSSQMNVDDDEMDEFNNNLVVEEPDKEMLIQRIGQTDYVLTMGGPFPGSDLEFKAILLFWGLFIVALIVPALGWTYFVSRDIKKIEAGSKLFSGGDHSARVKVSKISSMVEIASAFNQMAEKSQTLLESQKEIANSVSHEIRTPLARIKFSLEMLADSMESEDSGKNYLSEIGRDVEEIESLVDEMLTYARFGRERESSEILVRTEIVSWLYSVIQVEQKTLHDQAITYKNIIGQEKFYAHFEPVFMGWAIRNLIRNAARHTQKIIEVTLEPEETYIRIHVDDDGSGIPLHMRSKVFEPFFRIDKSRSRNSGGYGLGLAIAKRITLWHSGTIQITDSPFGGARFTITLPA